MSNDDFAPEPTDSELAAAAAWMRENLAPTFADMPSDEEIDRALDSME